jgi:uncharacterized protein
MALMVNLRHLEAGNVRLEGQLPVAELQIDPRDEVIHLEQPLEYGFEVQKLDGGLLIHGRLRLILQCECVRCLRSFQYELDLPEWACHLPLQGEEAVPADNDCVDLTGSIRDDILLAFPQHPLCRADCNGLPTGNSGKRQMTTAAGQPQLGSPAWNELNKLKF